VFENKELRTIFGPERDEVTGGWRKFAYKEIYKVYSSQNVISTVK
jgi:hypothetical protein